MKQLLLLLSLIFSSLTFAQGNFHLQRFLNSEEFPEDQTSTVFIKAHEQALEEFCTNHSCLVKKGVAGYHKVRISKSDLRDLNGQTFVEHINFTLSKGQTLNDSTRVINNVEPIHQGDTSLLRAYTGQGVLVGVIDGGIDQNHPDFQFTNGQTRIMKMWKQAASYSSAFTPVEFGYGRSYDSTDINSGTAGIGANQWIDHGCTVTGSAVGNANANGFHKGMAPESNLIIVSSDFNSANWKASVADAVDYIISVADSLNQPVVINASIGDYLGSHDGLDPTALYIDSVLAAKPGRLMVCAAGNSGAQPAYHLKTLVDTDTSFTWFEYNGSTAAGFPGYFIEIWADTADLQQVDFAFAVDKVSPYYDRRGVSNFHNLTGNLGALVEDTIWNNGNDLATIQMYMEQRNGQYLMQVAVASPDSSQYNLALLSTGNGLFDLWSASWLGLNNMPTAIPDSMDFPPIVNYVKPDTLVTIVDSWTCSPHVVTVSNFFSRLSYQSYAGTLETVAGTPGAISISSSKGPTRTNIMKPDVGATGDLALSAGSMNTLIWSQTNDPIKLDVGGLHIRNGGTSMASPIVCGIGALLLEKCPKITNDEFVQAVHDGAKADSFTGTLPNFAFGYGKVDGLATLTSTNFKPVISGDPYFCPGSFTTLSATIHDSIVWHTGSNSSSIFTPIPMNAYVNAWDNRGCAAVSDTVVVFEAPLPPTPSFNQIANGLTSSPAFDYQWFLNGSAITGETSQQHIAQTSGYYQVQVFNQYGCASISDSVWVSMTGIEEHSLAPKIYPNPTSNILNIESDAPFDYDFLDLQGRLIQKGETINSAIDLKKISPGTYLLIVKKGEKMWTYRIIKE